jgi:hypothetical protein
MRIQTMKRVGEPRDCVHVHPITSMWGKLAAAVAALPVLHAVTAMWQQRPTRPIAEWPERESLAHLVRICAA